MNISFDPVLAIITTILTPLIFLAISYVTKWFTKAEEDRTQAAVDALLEGQQDWRSKGTVLESNEVGTDGKAGAPEARDAVARQAQARLEQRLDALERRQIVADDRNFDFTAHISRSGVGAVKN